MHLLIFLECWDSEPDNRPTMNQVVERLKEIITKANITIEDDQINNDEPNLRLIGFNSSNNGASSSIGNSFHSFNEEPSKNINNFELDTKEMIRSSTPLDEQIISEENLSIKVNEI